MSEAGDVVAVAGLTLALAAFVLACVLAWKDRDR